MLRGINRQQIFVDDEDYEKFLWVLKETKEISGFRIYAFCLMDNHVHLLIREGKEPLERVFRRIGSKFVYWYNVKYQRTGHLFQDRYKSETVEDEAYFLTVIRYIHQNPVKAKICEKTEDYRYSSYNEYLNGKWLADTDPVLKVLPLEEFIAFNNQTNADNCIEFEDVAFKMTDEQLKSEVELFFKNNDVVYFRQLNAIQKQELVTDVFARGASVRQISRIAGISKGIVEKWLK